VQLIFYVNSSFWALLRVNSSLCSASCDCLFLQAEFLNTMPPREFVDCITDDLLGQGVFVFTPSGAPMRLPKVRASPASPAVP
jgi:hypothetical protein